MHWFMRLHRCWWRMLVTKCVCDNFEILVTALSLFVTDIFCHRYLFLSFNISVGHQCPKFLTKMKSPTPTFHQYLCSPKLNVIKLFLVNIWLWINFVESNSFFVRNSFNNQLIDCHQFIYFQLRMWSRCRRWCRRCWNVWHWCHRCLARCPKAGLNLEPNSSSERNRRFSNRSTDQSEVSSLKIFIFLMKFQSF